MRRHPEWERRLHAFVAGNVRRPHKFGQHDCLLFPAGGVEAVTGIDHGAPHRGKYRSFAGAYRHLGRIGFNSPEELLDSLFLEKPVGFAATGDLVLCDLSQLEDNELSASGPIPGLCMGAFALCILAEHPSAGATEGLVQVPREMWVKAWAVGEHHNSSARLSRRLRRARCRTER